MSTIYQTNLATSDNQEVQISSLAIIAAAVASLPSASTAAAQATSNTTLAQILSAILAAAGGANESQELAVLTSMLSGQATETSLAAAVAALSAINSKLAGPTVGSSTSVQQTPSSVLILAANPNRKGMYLYNDAGAKASISLGSPASTTAFSFVLAASAGYETPQTKVYTGAVYAIWNSGTTGFMRVTELT